MARSVPLSWRAEASFPEGCGLEGGLRRVSELLEKLDDFFDSVPGLGQGCKADLRLVCDEIGSNVVRHSAPKKATSLDVHVNADAESVRLRITDDGGEFNPFNHELPDIDSELDKRGVGGLGLFFIRQLFPLATYRRVDGRNCVEVEYILGRNGGKRMQRSSLTRRIIAP